MARRLALYVYVHDDDGVVHGFGPGTAVPGWAAKLITNPDAWAADAEPEPERQPAAPGPVEPPRAGPGSGRDAWKAYADAIGVQVADDTGRDDIVAAVDATAAPE